MPTLPETTSFKPVSFHEIPELKKAHSILSKLNKKYEVVKQQRKILENEKTSMANDVITILELIGEMTDPLFANRDALESKYFSTISDPEIARQQFLDDYESQHKPYDVVKNFAWSLFYKINELNDNE